MGLIALFTRRLSNRLTLAAIVVLCIYGVAGSSFAQSVGTQTNSPLSAAEVIQRALENELSIENISGHFEESYYITGPEGTSPPALVMSTDFTISFDGKFVLYGADPWSSLQKRVYDGTTVVRVTPASPIFEKFPLSVVDGIPSDLSFEALGQLNPIKMFIRPLHLTEMNGAPVAFAKFVIVESTEDVVVLETKNDNIHGEDTILSVSISLLPKKNFAISRYVSTWNNGKAIEHYEDHVLTNGGHWIPQKNRDVFYDLDSDEPTWFSETMLSDVRTNITFDNSTFDTSIPPDTPIIDYTKFGHWFFYWRTEYELTDYEVAFESIFESYPGLLFTILFVCAAIIVTIVILVYRTFFRHSPLPE